MDPFEALNEFLNASSDSFVLYSPKIYSTPMQKINGRDIEQKKWTLKIEDIDEGDKCSKFSEVGCAEPEGKQNGFYKTPPSKPDEPKKKTSKSRVKAQPRKIQKKNTSQCDDNVASRVKANKRKGKPSGIPAPKRTKR